MSKVIIKNFKQYICFSNDNLGVVIKKLNNNKLKLKFQIIVEKNYKVIGTITDGDIRRGILRNISLSSNISEVMNKDFIVGKKNDEKENYKKIEKLYTTDKAPFLPILTGNNILDSILVIYDVSQNNISTLIMAGGFGKRLGAHTEKKPKPLVEVAGKPILQHVLDKVFSAKIKDINISVHYMSDKISDFIRNQNLNNKVNIIYEEKPLGTIGVLGSIEDKKFDLYLVINSDVITDVSLNDFIAYHNDNKNGITIGAAIHEHEVPYGVIKFDKLGQFNGIFEKPTFKNFISAGIYVISKKASLLIPKNKHIDIPEFINLAKKAGFKIGVFPVHEYWTDVGMPETLNKANLKFSNKNSK